jgi:hypothetical protein|tara:strand:- start:215 stop:499 length:285 start_codon:yes stop_codon:yes gene_type:complete
MLDTLPDELLINILIFLNFRDKDTLNSRLINKRCCFLVDEPITIDGYPDIFRTSLYFFTMEYLFFIKEIEKTRKLAEKEFDDNYINMLIDTGWD